VQDVQATAEKGAGVFESDCRTDECEFVYRVRRAGARPDDFCVKEIIELLSAALAPITAIVALGIAYRQYRLEKIKFRHELYEKRLAIFNATMNLLAVVMRTSNVQMGDLIKFLQDTNQSYFLLGKDISDYLTEIYEKGVDLNCRCEMIHDSTFQNDEERTCCIKEKTELVKWFYHQLTVAREKFAKQISLDS
jgi:hypothetical protein